METDIHKKEKLFQSFQVLSFNLQKLSRATHHFFGSTLMLNIASILVRVNERKKEQNREEISFRNYGRMQ